MQLGSFLYRVVAAAWILQSLAYASSPGCLSHALQSSIEELVLETYPKPEFYQVGNCFSNAAVVGMEILKRFRPEVKPEHFKILVIRHKDVRFDRQIIADVLDQVIVPGKTYTRNGVMPLWSFHAVLEHDGKVIDLDRKEGWKFRPFNEYVYEMIPPNIPEVVALQEQPIFAMYGMSTRSPYNTYENLEVIELSLAEYLENYLTTPLRSGSIQFLEDFPKTPILEYLKKGKKD